MTAPSQFENAMTIHYTKAIFAFAATVLACFASCNSRTPEQRLAATEKVLQEIGVAPLTKPLDLPAIEKPAIEKSTVEAIRQEKLAPSIVKQSPLGEAGEDSNNQRDSGSTKISDATKEDHATSPAQAPQTPPKPTFTNDDPSRKWTTAESLPKETWEVQYFGNTPVGYLNHKVSVSQTLGSSHFRNETDSRIRVSLKGKPTEQRIQVTTIERDNGELISLEGFLSIGLNKQTFRGNVSQDSLKLSGDDNGQIFSMNIEWKKEYRGPFAVEQSMLRNPLKPRESRKLKYLDPLLRKIVDGRLEASDYIKTPTMTGGSQELLEIRNIGIIGETSAQSLLWVDKKGEGIKSFVQALDVLSFKTTPLAAQLVASKSDLQNIELTLIPLSGDVDRLAMTSKQQKSINYRVRHRTEEPYRMFTDRIGQRIRSIDANTVEVTVFENGGEAVPGFDVDTAPKKEPGTLSSSEFVPADSPQVTKLAMGLIATDKSLSPASSSNTDKAKSCQMQIQKRIELREFDNQIGTIANSLKKRQANCIEHALLFASVCRAAKIPARIVFGLKFNQSNEEPAMKFHSWIEILDDDHWVPMDSSEEVFPTSLDRIKVRESNFNGANPYLDILSVYRLLPQLEIQVMPR